MRDRLDAHLGKRVRHRRWMLNVTQQELAEATGVGIQMIKKYESGEIHMSASRLWDIATALKTPVAFFFSGQDGSAPDVDLGAVVRRKESIRLIGAYYAIPSARRGRLFDVAHALAAPDSRPGDSVA